MSKQLQINSNSSIVLSNVPIFIQYYKNYIITFSVNFFTFALKYPKTVDVLIHQFVCMKRTDISCFHFTCLKRFIQFADHGMLR